MKRYTSPYSILKYEGEYTNDPYYNPFSNRTVENIKTEIGKYAFPVVVGFRNFGESLDNVGQVVTGTQDILMMEVDTQ